MDACAALWCACCGPCSASRPPAADEGASPLGMSFVETSRPAPASIRPSRNFLVPHAARTFSNALDWQRRIFGWEPSERTTVCCCATSPTTATRASRRAAQHAAAVDIAPMSHAFETYPGERAHVLVDEPRDGARRDERHRVRARTGAGARFFLGKVPPQSAASRVAALQLPHGAALHRAALVPRGRRRVHGDLDGRRPRPRAGRLRRDGVSRDGARRRAFLRPARPRVARHRRSTSRSAPTPTSTARASSPGSPTPTRPRRWSPGCERDEGSRRYYADQFEQVFGMPLEQAWQRLDRLRARVPARATSPRCASIPITP